MDKKKHISIPSPAGGKEVRTEKEPKSNDSETPLWILSTFDYAGPWGELACIEADCAKHITEHLKSFESMTWSQILSASGGRTSGTNNHQIQKNRLSKAAQKRLTDIKLDDLDGIFSLRLEGTVRLYGIRTGRVLKLLWLDPWHNDPTSAVCPSRKRNT